MGNAYSSLKSIQRPIDLYIILFGKLSPFFKTKFFVFLSMFTEYVYGDVLDKYVQKYEEYFLKKKIKIKKNV